MYGPFVTTFCGRFWLCLDFMKMFKMTFLAAGTRVWMFVLIPVFKQLTKIFSSSLNCDEIDCSTWFNFMTNLFAQFFWCMLTSWKWNSNNINGLILITWQIELDFSRLENWNLFSFISFLSISSLQVTVMSFFIPMSFFASEIIIKSMKTVNILAKVWACLAIFYFKFWYQVGTFWYLLVTWWAAFVCEQRFSFLVYCKNRAWK